MIATIRLFEGYHRCFLIQAEFVNLNRHNTCPDFNRLYLANQADPAIAPVRPESEPDPIEPRDYNPGNLPPLRPNPHASPGSHARKANCCTDPVDLHKPCSQQPFPKRCNHRYAFPPGSGDHAQNVEIAAQSLPPTCQNVGPVETLQVHSPKHDQGHPYSMRHNSCTRISGRLDTKIVQPSPESQPPNRVKYL